MDNRNSYGGGRPQGGAHKPFEQKKERQEPTIAGKQLSGWQPEIKQWITAGIEKDTVRFADDMGRVLTEEKLTTSQIRNIFGEMRKIQMNGFRREKSDFLLLKPKLAYAVKRQNAKGLDLFYQMFSYAFDAIDTTDVANATEQFNNLMNLAEAVLAFHKFHGGKDN